MFELYSGLDVIRREGRGEAFLPLATIRISLTLLHRARPTKRWRSIVRRLITNNRTFTALNWWSNETCWRALHRCWHWFPAQLYALYFYDEFLSFASITVDRCANCRSRVKRRPIQWNAMGNVYGSVRKFLLQQSRDRSSVEIEQYVTYGSQLRLLCKWMVFNFRDKRWSKMSNNRWNLPTFHSVGYIQDSKENWRARQKSIYRIYIYIVRETYCLSACMSVVQPVLSTVWIVRNVSAE